MRRVGTWFDSAGRANRPGKNDSEPRDVLTAERMRCAGMTKFSRCAWPIILTLAAGPSAAFAESLACYAVQRDDTASRLAKRITGDASNEYQPWFDIV